MSRGESLEDFQHVGEFRGQFPDIRRRLRFMRLLQQLGPQGRLIRASWSRTRVTA
jgi:hypothetical protein